MQSHTRSDTPVQTMRRWRGEILEPDVVRRLGEHIARVGWRCAGVELRMSERTMRAILKARPVHHGSAVALRAALARLAAHPEAQP